MSLFLAAVATSQEMLSVLRMPMSVMHVNGMCGILTQIIANMHIEFMMCQALF